MKMVAEYLERALAFERMATAELNPELKAQFEKQAEAYRRLAEGRAEKISFELPPDES